MLEDPEVVIFQQLFSSLLQKGMDSDFYFQAEKADIFTILRGPWFTRKWVRETVFAIIVILFEFISLIGSPRSMFGSQDMVLLR